MKKAFRVLKIVMGLTMVFLFLCCSGTTDRDESGVSGENPESGQVGSQDTDSQASEEQSQGLPNFWRMEDQSKCLVKNENSECVPGGAGDFLYLPDGSIRFLFWSGFRGPGTGGVGSALSTDGGTSFQLEDGLRVVSSGIDGQWDYNLDQPIAFPTTSGWNVLIGSYSQRENAGGPNTLFLFSTTDGLQLFPIGPALGKGAPNEDLFSFVGRGSVWRMESGELRALFTCNLKNGKQYGLDASDLCGALSSDDGRTWTIDQDLTVHPWASSDHGVTWIQDMEVTDGIIFTDANEAYVFPLSGDRYGVVFTFLTYGMFGAESDDGIHWSEPKKLDLRHSDGVTTCYHSDPNEDGEFRFEEDSLNCEVGDMTVLRRTDGTFVIVSNYPAEGYGVMGYIGIY